MQNYNYKIWTNLLIALVLIACGKVNISTNGWTTYHIKKGEHSSIHGRPIDAKRIEFLAIFDSSAMYNLNNGNQGDINKLYGLSDCGCFDHLINSARIGWNYTAGDSVNIYAYVHKNRKFSFKHITNVKIGSETSYNIICSGNEYIFIVNSSMVTMSRGCDKKRAVY